MIEPDFKIGLLPDISLFHSSAESAIKLAIDTLVDMLSAPRYKIIGGSIAYNILRRDMPYVIHETALPGTFILVNRNYKPVGSSLDSGGTDLKYEDFTNLHIQLDSAPMAKVEDLLGHSRYLFGDPPWNGREAAMDYLGRLRRLHHLVH